MESSDKYHTKTRDSLFGLANFASLTRVRDISRAPDWQGVDPVQLFPQLVYSIYMLDEVYA